MMTAQLSRTCDAAIINSRGIEAADDPTQPVLLPNALPDIIKKRFDQAMRVNTRADWQAFAKLCSTTAIAHFQDSHYDPNNADFRSLCQLSRIAHLRGMACLAHGVSMARASREG